MEVKDFSDELYDAAKKSSNGRTFSNLTRYLVGAGVVTTEVFALNHFRESLLFNPIYYGSGTGSFVASSAIDDNVSNKTFELFNDPRFKEYGLEKFWWEGNGTLPPYPTKKQGYSKSQKALKLAGTVLSTIIPPLGHTMLALSTLTYENNCTVNERIEKGLQIGDEVNRMIKDGKSESDIKIYLVSLRNAK